MDENNSFKFTFSDLFAGIGGFHLALKELGGECVFASEFDANCRKTYEYNFNNFNEKVFTENMFVGDITKIDEKNVPYSDIICAGFPCQPFSQAGKKRGFEDTRGTLFFDVARIVKAVRPKAVFLENVRGLLNHDKGKTFEVIKNTMEELGYSFYYKVLKASDFNCPQNRPRLYMVAFRKDIDSSLFKFPEPIELKKDMSWVFNGATVNRKVGFTLRVGGKGSPIKDRRNWDGYIVNGEEKRIGIDEAKRMQGFPEKFYFPVSNTAAMKELGNSVAVPVISAIGKNIISVIKGDIKNE